MIAAGTLRQMTALIAKLFPSLHEFENLIGEARTRRVDHQDLYYLRKS